MALNYHLSPEQVRQIRRSLNETQVLFASRLGVDAVTVARWETGKRKCIGLYAKVILELGGMLTVNKDVVDKNPEDSIRFVELGDMYSFCSYTAPLLQFMYKEVPLDYRQGILEKYQEWFETWAYTNNFLINICNQKLIGSVGYFLRPFIRGPIYPELNEGYEVSKLSQSYLNIYKVATQLAPNYDFERILFKSSPNAKELLLSIKLMLEQLLEVSHIELELKGDFALIKFYHCLLNYVFDEMNQRKSLPIPNVISFSFASIVTVVLQEPLSVSMPNIDDHTQLNELDKITRYSVKDLKQSFGRI